MMTQQPLQPVYIGIDKSNGRDETCYCISKRQADGTLVVHGIYETAEEAFIEAWKIDAERGRK